MRFEINSFLEAACCLHLVINKLNILVSGSWSDQHCNTIRFFLFPTHPPTHPLTHPLTVLVTSKVTFGYVFETTYLLAALRPRQLIESIVACYYARQWI